MSKTILKAEKRVVEGRKVKNLRKKGFLPGNVYGKKVKSQSVQVNLKEFEKVYKEVGETGILTLDLGADGKPVLIHNLQLNPVSDIPVHVDFLQVDLKEKVEANIPVELVGESPAEKHALGTVVQYVNEIKVESLPMDLPDQFEIDINLLTEVDQFVSIKDLKYDKSKVEIKDDLESIVVKVEPPQKEEIVETPVPAEGETPKEETGEEEVDKEGQKTESKTVSNEEPQK